MGSFIEGWIAGDLQVVLDNIYLNSWTMAGINQLRLQAKNDFQWIHVIMKILKDSSPLSKNAVTTEESIIFLQMKDYMILAMSRGKVHSKNYDL